MTLPPGVSLQGQPGWSAISSGQVNISYTSQANATPTQQATLALSQSNAPSAGAPMQTQASVTITDNGTVIASSAGSVNCGQQCNVVVGQLLTLTGSPSGGTWSVPGRAYTQWLPGIQPLPVNPTTNPTAFFLTQGGYSPITVTVAYTVNGTTASAPFMVSAPIAGYAATFTNPHVVNPGGNLLIQGGMNATVAVNSPPGFAGTTTWLQTIPSLAYQKSASGLTTLICQPPGSPPWLDGGNPYPPALSSPTSFQDGPGVNLTVIGGQGYTGTVYSAVFNNYLMWQPTSVPGTTFPVPLVYNFWTVYFHAQLLNGSWAYGGATNGNEAGLAQPANYPTWVSVAPYPFAPYCAPLP